MKQYVKFIQIECRMRTRKVGCPRLERYPRNAHHQNPTTESQNITTYQKSAPQNVPTKMPPRQTSLIFQQQNSPKKF